MSDPVLCRMVTAENGQRFLAPADEFAEARFRKSRAKSDQVFTVIYKRARSPHFHNLVMRIIRDMYENQREDQVVIHSEEVFRAKIKMEAGWVYEEPYFENGELNFVVKPTDWSNCDQEEFEEFFAKLRPVIVERLGEHALDQYRL